MSIIDDLNAVHQHTREARAEHIDYLERQYADDAALLRTLKANAEKMAHESNATGEVGLLQPFIETLTRAADISTNDGIIAAFRSMHRTHQQMLVRQFFMPVLEALAKDFEAGNFDARNEGACKFAKAAVEARNEQHIHLPYV